MANDTITRKDIITDDAVKWGSDYVKEVEKAIGKNQEFINSMKILNDLAKESRLTKNINEFTEAQKKADAQMIVTNNVWKEQIQLENQLISTKKKNELATEGTNRELAKQKILLQQQNAQVKQEAQNQLGLVSVYQKVQNKLNALGKEYSDLSIRKNLGAKLTDEEIKRYEFLEKKITTYDKALKLTDANQGKHQRNVGDYAKGFDVLGNSINQLTREAPAFAVSMNTGFLAISNNIPAFFDALQTIKKQNIELAKAGQPVKSVAAQLTSSLFSVQTALSVGVTLLTLYGGKLIELASNALKTTEQLNAMKKAQEDVNFAVHKGVQDSQDEVTHLRNLEGVILDNTASMHKRLGAVEDLRKLMPDHLKNYSDEAILAGQASVAIDKLAQSLTNSAIAQALESRIAQQAVKDYDNRRKLVAQINADIRNAGANVSRETIGSGGGSIGIGGTGTAGIDPALIKKREKIIREEGLRALKAFDEGVAEAAKARTAEFNKFFTPSADVTGGSGDKKTKEPKKLQGVADTTFELEKQRLERIIFTNDEIVKDQEKTEADRIEALGVSLETQEELINKSKNNQLENLKFAYEKEKSEGNKTKEGLIQLEENYTADRLKITEKASNDIIDINKKTDTELTVIFEQSFKKRLDLIHKNTEKEKDIEDAKMVELKKSFLDGEISYEDYLKKLERLKEESDAKILSSTIDALTEELQKYANTNDQKKIIEKELHDLKMKLLGLEVSEKEKAEEEYAKKRDEIIKRSSGMLAEALGADAGLLENFLKHLVDGTKITTEDILEVSTFGVQALGSITKKASDAKIEGIQAEIDKNNEYFDKQKELYEGDEQAQKTIEKERELRNAELNKKIVKEKEKQAKFDKAVAIAQIAIQTALSIVKASPNPVLIALAAVAGAIALATAIATPIPKFRRGTMNAPQGLAVVGDGGVNEVVTNAQGLNPVLTPATDTFMNLNKGDKVFPNIGAYQDYLRSQQIRQMGSFGAVQSDDRMLNEMKQTRKSIERLKLSVKVSSQKTDLSHQFWAKQNRNWN